VEFVEIANAAALTGAQVNSKCAALKAISFGRVEQFLFDNLNLSHEV
jgi:hypothetical protein